MNGDWTLGLRHLWVCVAAAGMMLFSSCGDKPVPAPEEQVDSRPLPTGPDVILVLVCTARADQMTPWGAPKNVTPTLHAMAQRGVRFEQTIAQAPWTRPGSSAVLTGRHPSSIGMAETGGGRNNRPLSESVTTMAEHFFEAGYATVGITGNPNLNKAYGFGQGFQEYLETSPPMRDGGVKVGGHRIVKQLLPEIQRVDQERPLFLQVVLVDSHRPFSKNDTAVKPFESNAPSRLVAAYRHALSVVDQSVGALHEALKGSGRNPEEALWIVVGDHGEGLKHPEHHGISHGNYLYPSAVQVPWIMSGAAIPKPSVVGGLSGQIDVLPTVLGLLGMPKSDVIEGRDFSELIRQGGGTTDRERVFTSTWFRWADRAAVYAKGRMCQKDFDPMTTRRKLAKPRAGDPQYAFADACFDLVADPECRVPLMGTEELEALTRWRKDQERLIKNQAKQGDVEVSSEVDAALEALGYAQ